MLQRNVRFTFLALVVFITAMVWVRASEVSYTPDDYQCLHYYAPINSSANIWKEFVSTDPMSLYWRPATNAALVFDFICWHWNGKGSRITNIVIHLIATLLVFFFVKRFFRFDDVHALLVMVLFGVSPAHEANILWAAGRSDSMATLFLLCALLADRRSERPRYALVWKIAGCISFLLSVSSKEIGVVFIPLVFLLSYRKKNLKECAVKTLPYFLIGVLFFFYRSGFTPSISSAEPLSGGATHSVSVLVMNIIYTLGYTFIPLNLETATSLINASRPVFFTMAGVCALILIAFIFFLAKKKMLQAYFFPVVFLLLSGSITFISFERWRVYMLSVGLFAIVVMAMFDIMKVAKNSVISALLWTICSVVVLFYVVRSESAIGEWTTSTKEIVTLKNQLSQILSDHPSRPIRFLFLDRPSKLGSAPLLQLSIDDLLEQAELEQTKSPLLAVGGTNDTININSETTLIANAADVAQGFEGLQWQKISADSYRFFAKDGSGISFIPAIQKNIGFAKRDEQFNNSETLVSNVASVIVTLSKGNYVTDVIVHILDTSFVPLIFDGKKFFVP